MSQVWNNQTFTELMRTQSMRKAFEYRLETLGTPIPEEHLTEEEKEALANPVAPVEVVETQVDADTLETPEQEAHREEIQSLEGTTEASEAPEVIGSPIATSTEEAKKEYTVEEVKALLTEKGIKFHHLLGPEKIMELAVANNLI